MADGTQNANTHLVGRDNVMDEKRPLSPLIRCVWNRADPRPDLHLLGTGTVGGRGQQGGRKGGRKERKEGREERKEVRVRKTLLHFWSEPGLPPQKSGRVIDKRTHKHTILEY